MKIFTLFVIMKSQMFYDNLLRKKFGDFYDDNTLYVISIQGPTSSGKSSLSERLLNLLSEKRSYLMKLDDFYTTCDGKFENEDDLDFDSPKILHWDNIYKVINFIINKKERIPVYKRSTESCNNLSYIKNNNVNILIIEGLYAFNCFSKKIFNLKEFDIRNSNRLIINEFVENNKLLGNKFKETKLLNIRLTLCKNKLFKIRIKRDKILRNLPEDKILLRLEKFIWPNTLKWVYSDIFQDDCNIQHGNFNETETYKLSCSLGKYFGSSEKYSKKVDINLYKEFLIDCSEECLLQDKKRN